MAELERQRDEPHDASSPFASRLRRAREERGKTQAELANAIGKSRPSVAFYELGKSVPPSAVIEAIAKVLGLDPRYLAYGPGGATEALGAEHNRLIRQVTINDDGEEISEGTMSVPNAFMDNFSLPVEGAKLVAVPQGAPAFNIKPGSFLFVDASDPRLLADGAVYVVHSTGGPCVVRTVAALIHTEGEQTVSDGHGRALLVDYSQVRVIGRLRGTMSHT